MGGVFAFGLMTGILLKKCVSHSLTKRDCQVPGWIFYLPIINGFLYVGVIIVLGWQVESLFVCLCISSLMAIGITDQQTLEIPWGYNLFIGGIGGFKMLLHLSRWYEYFVGFFAVSSLLFLLFLLTDGKGIGGGDVKLMAVAGLFLGWEKAMQAFLIGGIAGIAARIICIKNKNKTKIFALGPYLAIGIFIVMLR